MRLRGQSKKPIQKTFLSDLAPETVSAICSHLNMNAFFRFQSCSTQYQKSELYDGVNYAGLQSEFEFLLESGECLNADEILANVIKRGGAVKMGDDLLGAMSWECMIMRSYFKLFDALQVRNLIGNDGRNALFAKSAYRGNFEFCKLLVDLGADVDYVDDDEHSILLSACYSGDLKIVKLVVTAGANVNFLSAHGQTPLSIAMACPDDKYGASTANFLLDSGSDHTLADEYGDTCLHNSVRLCDFDLYKRFLDMGVDSSLRNDEGETAIELLVDSERDGDSENYGIDSVTMIKSLFKYYEQLSPEDRLLNERKIIEMLIHITEIGKLMVPS